MKLGRNILIALGVNIWAIFLVTAVFSAEKGIIPADYLWNFLGPITIAILIAEFFALDKAKWTKTRIWVLASLNAIVILIAFLMYAYYQFSIINDQIFVACTTLSGIVFFLIIIFYRISRWLRQAAKPF